MTNLTGKALRESRKTRVHFAPNLQCNKYNAGKAVNLKGPFLTALTESKTLLNDLRTSVSLSLTPVRECRGYSLFHE